MKTLWKKALSLTLAFIMVFQLLPTMPIVARAEGVGLTGKELDEAKKQTEQYKDWWYSGVKEVEEQQKVIDGLKGELDKVAAVAELYLKSKVWQK